MENFAIQSLVKWLIIKLIPRFIRAFHAHAGLQSYIFFAENQIFSADFRSLRGRGWFGGGHTAARQRVSARSASGGAEGRKVQRLSAQQKARTDATESPDGQAYVRTAMALRPLRKAERKEEECRGSARHRESGRSAAKHPDGARQRGHTARQRRPDCSGLARQGRTMRCRGRLSGRSGDSSSSSSSSTSATWSSSIRPSEYSRPR